MVRRTSGVNDARVYDVSDRSMRAVLNMAINNTKPPPAHRTEDAIKRTHRRQEIDNTGMNLIQDFEFPTLCNRIYLSNDDEYIFATGIYPRQIQVYDTKDLSLKYNLY